MKTLIRNKPILLDDEDYDRVVDFEKLYNRKWSASNRDLHVILRLRGVTVQLGRFILNYWGPLLVDHKDQNPLNNQKSNLRVATRAQNLVNSVAYNGSKTFETANMSRLERLGIR